MLSHIRSVVLLAVLLGSASLVAQQAPDTILLNGKIVTVDDYFSIQEAVAIGGERILAVGTNAEVRALAGTGATIVDLDGRTVIPGLIDNHNHKWGPVDSPGAETSAADACGAAGAGSACARSFEYTVQLVR